MPALTMRRLYESEGPMSGPEYDGSVPKYGRRGTASGELKSHPISPTTTMIGNKAATNVVVRMNPSGMPMRLYFMILFVAAVGLPVRATHP